MMATKPTAPQRRASDRPWWAVAFRWLFALVVDKWEGLSLTRFLAIGTFLFVWHAKEGGHALTATDVSVLFLAIATAFGKATFTMLAQRTTLTLASSDTTTRTVTEAITARRIADPVDGIEYEPTPRTPR